MKDLSRRQVLQSAAMGMLAPSVLARYEAEGIAEAQAGTRRKLGPNDTIQLGLIGPGGSRGGYRQGLGVARGLHGKNARVIAVCDVDQVHLNEAAAVFGAETAKYKDYRELLSRKDIDAVVIGTPDHWHHRQCLDAMEAGKDVYCEKPLTLTVQQGREIADMARKTKSVFQTGSQQRSEARFRLACELVRNGRIGKISHVKTCLPTGPVGGPFSPKSVPSDLDWNMWLGPAPMTEYLFERTHGNFRWWLDYSGGMLTDWGAHHNDIAQWGLGMDGTGPILVAAEGKGQPILSRFAYSTFPEYEVDFRYANGVRMTCTNKGDNGVTFTGDEGWIFVTRGDIKASDPKLLEPIANPAIKLEATPGHGQNFLDCMRSRKDPICHAEIGHRSISICHLANISLRTGGRRLDWDPVREIFPRDAEATAMLNRPDRRW